MTRRVKILLLILIELISLIWIGYALKGFLFPLKSFEVIGTITSLGMEKNAKGFYQPVIKFEYKVAESLYKGHSTLTSPEVLERYSIGQKISLYCEEGRPDNTFMERPSFGKKGLFTYAIIAIVFQVLFLLFFSELNLQK
jgi:hypothetical protein